MHACTIIARNYLAHARVLAESFLEHHPGGRFTTLVLDAENMHAVQREPFRVVSPYDIGLLPAELHRMAMIYDVLEIATAVKPAFLRRLLRDDDDVSYFDPDIRIYAPLDDVSRLAREHKIVLVPHLMEPIPRDGQLPSEETILAAGVFNLGFIAVGRGSEPFLDWWAERLARNCFLRPEAGQFVDQRWVDLVSGMFEHTILRDFGADVAHWNVFARDLRLDGERWMVGDVPLRFYHFTGFDPHRPWILSRHQGTSPRVRLSERADLARLCEEYAEELLACGYDEARSLPYLFDRLPGGLSIDAEMRNVYREELARAEAVGSGLPPDPFEPSSARAFVAWLDMPATPASPAAKASSYPNRLRREWPASGASAVSMPLPHGLNVAGYFRAELGVGEAGRQIIEGIKASGVPFSTVIYSAGTSIRQEHPFDGAETAAPVFDTNLVCVNADRLVEFASDMGPDFFRDRYTIGVWWWEVDVFPQAMHRGFDIVDEVWVGSDHIRAAIARETQKPVQTIPIPVRVPEAESLTRAELGLPDGFLFLFLFDFLSTTERKNPRGLVEAFTRAFPKPGQGPVLVIKSINGERAAARLEELHAAAAGRPDIRVIDEYVSAHAKNSFVAMCDCYVSLHRSEGFGLTMAEAMSFGKPVIATGYSGNLTFMTEENSFLVPYVMSHVPEGADPYPQQARWAEPDLDRAAELMRYVYEHPEEARERGERGRREIEQQQSPERLAAFVARRLEEIRERRLTTPATHVPEEVFGLVRARPGPLARARAAVANESAGIGTDRASLGPAVVLARRVLNRLLFPYVSEQHKLHTALVEAAEALEARLERDERRAAGAAEEAHWRGVKMEQERGEPESLTTVAGHLRSEVERLAPAVDELAARLHAVTGDLTTPPYIADPDVLRTEDPEGRATIGYRGVRGAPGYLGFEEVFRGSEELIRERQRVYLDVFAGYDRVLDLGCGRGEFLDLLREAGKEGRGVDLDEAMVSHCRTKGHDVALADVNEYLDALEDGSLDAVFSAQVIEHLRQATLMRFLESARRKLRPGGLLVAETVNPHCIRAFKTFWTDRTHEPPIFPEVAVTLCRVTGYESAWVLFPNGTGDLERDRVETGEYAVIARNPSHA